MKRSGKLEESPDGHFPKEGLDNSKNSVKEDEYKQDLSNSLTELNLVLPIREYLINTINNSNIDRATVNYMNGALILLDKKILKLIQSDSFKQYINYADVKQAVQDVVNLNNIKSGIKR